MTTDIFKSYCGAMDRQIERKRFNPDLTHGEYTALSETEKWEWNQNILNYWDARCAETLDWDYEPSGYQDETNGEFSA
jgi:hypothetical protein